MKRDPRKHQRRWRQLVAQALFAAVALGVVCATIVVASFRNNASSAALPADQPRTEFNAAHVVGPSECRVCHQSEFDHWKTTHHAGRAFDLLRTEATARDYAERLGIPQDRIAVDSVCVRCHATPRVDEFGQPDVVPGVSCESCHNPAGGVNGWLNSHAVYGPAGTLRQHETAAHFADRLERNAAAGKNSPYDLYSLALRCFACHAVGEEALVNAGHSSGTRAFEFAEAFLPELRHNYHLDQDFNSEVSSLWLQQIHAPAGRTVAGRKRLRFVLGAMAELEIALRNLAKATDPDGEFYEDASDRVLDAYEYLAEDIAEELTETPDALQAALSAAAPLYAKVDDDEFSLADDAAACREAADAIAAAGHQLATTSKGDEFGELPEPIVPAKR